MIFTKIFHSSFWAALLKLFSSAKRVTVPSFILVSNLSRFHLIWAIIRPTSIASECYWLSVGDSPPYGRLSCRWSTVHFFARVKVLDSRVRKYKRCSFSCDMEKYSTCPRKKVFAWRLKPHSLDECCIFQYHTQKKHRSIILSCRGLWHWANINPFKPEFTIVISIHYKPRIAVAILDL